MVSIIVDNYNYGQYISEAIGSILNQTYEEYEIIIVDDGSNDNSRKVILDYCDRFPKKVIGVFKSNGGQASAFNTGYSLAKGDIICFLDSDDYWYRNKLERIVEEHQSYDFVAHNKKYSNGIYISQNLKLEYKNQKLLKDYGYTCFYNIITSEMSFTRKLLNKILPMPEDDFKICADEYILLYGLYFSNLKYIDEPLMCYRVHENNRYLGKLDIDFEYGKAKSFNTVRRINQDLIKNNNLPIPYINKYLRKLMYEIEEKFYIEKESYIIYGTGQYSRSIKKYIEFCGGSVKYYCDSDDKKWGNNIEGIYIISPNDLVDKRNEYYKIVIASIWLKEISNILNTLGLKENDDYIYSEIVVDF